MSKCKVKLKLTIVDWKNEGFSRLEEWAENYMINELNCELTTFSIHDPTPYTSALKYSGDIFINNDDLYKVEVVSQELDITPLIKIDNIDKYNGGYFITGEYDNSSATLRNFFKRAGYFMERYLEEK